MSISGSLPASSENSDAREGMPDLNLTGEVGPKLVYNIFEHGVHNAIYIGASISYIFYTLD